MIYPVVGTDATVIVILVPVKELIVPITGAAVIVTPVSLLTTWYVNWTESLASNPVVSATVIAGRVTCADPVPGKTVKDDIVDLVFAA
jgi:hypothetical protein